MKKALIMAIIAMLLAGCGQKKVSNNTIDLTEERKLSDEEIQKIVEEIKEDAVVFNDHDVNVILPMIVHDGRTPDEHIADMASKHPENRYSVYEPDPENYYIQTMKESERRAQCDRLNNGEVSEEQLKKLFEDELYAGVFVDMTYSSDFREFIHHVNRQAYDRNFSARVAVLFYSKVISQSMQGYMMVPIEERSTRILILDENDEVLYDSMASSGGAEGR